MVYKNILITGGAGFIGYFLSDALIEQGYNVRILDNLEGQVHQGKIPQYLNPKAEFVKGDVKDYEVLKKSLEDIDVVFHLAARVGVAQSNYQIKDYSDANIGGMSNLLDIVVNSKTKVKKILMTASMTSYGEGLYQCEKDGSVHPGLRNQTQLSKKDWNIYCPICGSKVSPIPTSEETSTENNSMYSLTKNVQETMLMLVGKLYGIPVVSLRCFNVYGPRQSLSNPYTGVSAIFISRLKNNHQPVVYEDGMQSRDFVSIHDVVSALIKAMNSDKANFEKINIGSGTPTSIKELAEKLAKLLGKDIQPKVSGDFRKNDICHCFADITKAKKILDWEPSVSLDKGLEELIEWSNKENAEDLYEKAQGELKEKKLTV